MPEIPRGAELLAWCAAGAVSWQVSGALPLDEQFAWHDSRALPQTHRESHRLRVAAAEEVCAVPRIAQVIAQPPVLLHGTRTTQL